MSPDKLVEKLTRWERLLNLGMRGDIEGREALTELAREIAVALLDEENEHTRHDLGVRQAR